MSTITTRAGKGSPLTNTEVDDNFSNLNNDKIENVVEDTTPQLGGNLDTNGNDVTFGDNDKAIFGAGSDLQIYHDGANNYINGQTGSIIIQNTNDDYNVIIKSDDGSGGLADYFRAKGDTGAALMYHYGSAKLSTTSTGIDVTGTATMDGLTVDGTGTAITLKSNNNAGTALNTLQFLDQDGSAAADQPIGNIEFYSSDANSAGVAAYITSLNGTGSTGDITIGTGVGGSAVDRMKIEFTGDISFYEDTGTTAKLVWSAANESLNIGNGGASNPLSVQASTGASVAYLNNTDSADGNGLYVQAGGVNSGKYVAIFADQANNNRMQINANGNVGIGTSSPTDLLNISGSSNQIGLDTGDQATYGTLDVGHFTNGAFIGTQAGSNAAADILRLGTGGSERMRIDSSGNVGIGTSSPSTALDIVASNGNQFRIANTTTDATLKNAYLSVRHYTNAEEDFVWALAQSNANTNDLNLGGSTSIGNAATSIKFFTAANNTTTAGAEAMRIDSSGNLLVGTTSTLGSTQGFKALSSGLTRAVRDGDVALAVSRLTSDGDIVAFQKDGTTVGSIGSNTTAGNPLLDINSQSHMRFVVNGDTSATEAMRLDDSGRLLVSTTSVIDSSKVSLSYAGITYNGFAVNDTDGASGAGAFKFLSSGTVVGSITTTTSATAYNTSSDYRLKEDWQPVANASDRVAQLKPVNFAWKVDGSRVDGFLAHELAEVVPEAVTGEKDAVDDEGNPEYQAIDQSKLVPLLTAALQEALTRIETLEAEVTALKGA
jgi:hypothetical protein